MATILSPRNAARFGADVWSDSPDGIRSVRGRTVRTVVERDDVVSRARKNTRRRVKRAERAAWRADVAAILADERPPAPVPAGPAAPWWADARADAIDHAAYAFGWLVDRAANETDDGPASVRGREDCHPADLSAFDRAAMLAGRTVRVRDDYDGAVWTGTLSAVWTGGGRARVNLTVGPDTFSCGMLAACIIGPADGAAHGIRR